MSELVTKIYYINMFVVKFSVIKEKKNKTRYRTEVWICIVYIS